MTTSQSAFCASVYGVPILDASVEGGRAYRYPVLTHLSPGKEVTGPGDGQLYRSCPTSAV